jgi:hypothetical protein
MPYNPRQMGDALQNMRGPQGGSMPNVQARNSRMGNSPIQAVMPNEQLQPSMDASLGYQSPNQPNPPPVPQNMQPGLQRNMGFGGMVPRPLTNPRGY